MIKAETLLRISRILKSSSEIVEEQRVARIVLKECGENPNRLSWFVIAPMGFGEIGEVGGEGAVGVGFREIANRLIGKLERKNVESGDIPSVRAVRKKGENLCAERERVLKIASVVEGEGDLQRVF